jgi:hypothetical protein
MGIILNRKEALSYLKEVLDACKQECSPDKILFEKNRDNIIIRMKSADLSGQTIREVARKYSYNVNEENGEFVIFK